MHVTPMVYRVASSDSHLLSLRSVSKQFSGVLALDRVDLKLSNGEVLALIGENGAGKSTLIKILAGIHPCDSGEIRIDNASAEIHNVRDAMNRGISVIHQELNLSDNLNIAENIFLGRQPFTGGRFFQITKRKILYKRSTELLERVGLEVSPRTQVEHLSIGQKQMVEIAKALSLNARIIIFDEPTSSLSSREAERLFEVIKNLRQSGMGIIYISHRLKEVQELSDRVMVLRDGKKVGELTREEVDYNRMVSMMVGRNIDQYYHHQHHKVNNPPALEVIDLEYPAAHQPVNFVIRQSEIVGFAGLVGAGRSELARVLFGVDPLIRGKVRVNSKDVKIRSPKDAIKVGMMLVPEERKTQGLVLEMPISANISLARLPQLAPFGLLNRRAERELASKQVARLSIRTAGLKQLAVNLSGGNQQKVVLGKWLAMNPAVLILDEPTRGVDVGAKSEIYGLISQLTEKGVAIMMISSEMEEVIAMSDRVIIMHEGKIMGEVTGEQITEENIMTLSTGSQ
jgi:ribose transport system ATP-binding protein